MATITPDIEKARTLKQPATEGELFLLQHLKENFDADAEVFFQPCFNGERPDVVIIKKGVGAIIIEVKDWQLDSYKIDSRNLWFVAKHNCSIKSPFAQAFGYKKNLFEVHANGLLDRSLASESFYGLVKVYVYFHHASRNSLRFFYDGVVSEIRQQMDENQQAFREKLLSYDAYEKRRVYLSNKKKQIERDLNSVAITRESLSKISFPGSKSNPAFDDGVYNEFMRLLRPPYHYANEGKLIDYSKPQLRLSESEEGARVKVCGVAGSGKTAVLARRAVNAHKRHGEPVLILTFNLTLRQFIHDKISEVREGFSWEAFHITNYHKFIGSALNAAGIDVAVEQGVSDVNAYLERKFYSNLGVFDSAQEPPLKYKTILIDEAQDYKPEWQRIIRDNFLEEHGEMVLFSDEKQDIYERGVDEERRANVINGFGRWQRLSTSFRCKQDSPILRLALAFQQQFLSDRYEVDGGDLPQYTPSLVGLNAVVIWSPNDLPSVASLIISMAKREQIHPNDITVLSSWESSVRELDYLLRTGVQHQERTLTSFASKENFDRIQASKLPDGDKREALRKASASRKVGFNLNSGVMKLATLHSFKGFESPTVFLLLHDTDGPELIYTGITRAKENIVVLVPADSRYVEFFMRNLDLVSLPRP